MIEDWLYVMKKLGGGLKHFRPPPPLAKMLGGCVMQKLERQSISDPW